MTKLICLALSLLPAWGAITRTGDPGSVASSANSNSTTISVPSDATLIVVAVGGYNSSMPFFGNGSSSVTLNGQALTLGRNDFTSDVQEAAIYYRVNPSTGDQTLAWDWVGTSSVLEGTNIIWAFYKGVDTSNSVRSSGGQSFHSSSAVSSGSLSCEDGDVAVAFYSHFNNEAASWTGATEIHTPAYFNSTRQHLAEAFPTGSSITITATNATTDWKGLSVIVFRAATSPATKPRRKVIHQ